MLESSYHTPNIEELFINVTEFPAIDEHIPSPYTVLRIGDFTWYPSERQVVELTQKLFDYVIKRPVVEKVSEVPEAEFKGDTPCSGVKEHAGTAHSGHSGHPTHSDQVLLDTVPRGKTDSWHCPNYCGCGYQDHDSSGCLYCLNCNFAPHQLVPWSNAKLQLNDDGYSTGILRQAVRKPISEVETKKLKAFQTCSEEHAFSCTCWIDAF